MSRSIAIAAVALAILGLALAAVGCGGAQDSSNTTAVAAGGPGAPPAGAPGAAPGGGSQVVETGTGAYTVKDGETLDGGTYDSTNADENAIRAEGDVTATLRDVTVQKTAGAASSNDASSFYGLNAAILALDDADLTISGGAVTATAGGANGVFAYGHSIIRVTGTTIDVSGGNAGGIQVAGGGTIEATDLTVSASVKAAIRSDRGGGSLTADGGTYTTSGSSGAPVIYSTANIIASNATLTANDSEAVVIEGLNSATLIDCETTGNMSGTYSKTDTANNIHNVMLYQSMSGDAAQGTSTFTMTGGTLTSKNGDMFYVTNTSSVIALSNADLTLADGTYLLRVAGNTSERGWGTPGANGGTCEFDLGSQTATGDILVDSISNLTMSLVDSSAYTGAINSDGTEAAKLSVTLDSTSKWIMTADSYVTEFNGNMENVITNGHTLYVDGKAKN